MKREKYTKEDGKFLTAYDIRIGEPLTLYGRVIYLYNCDDYTREFYEKINQPQGPAQSYENDQWTTTMTNKWVPKKDAQMKEYLEKNWEEAKLTLRSNFLRMTEEFLNSMLNLKKLPSSFTISWLMIHSKSENAPFPTQEEIHSQ